MVKPRVEITGRALRDVRADGVIVFVFAGEKNLAAALPPELKPVLTEVERRGFKPTLGQVLATPVGEGAARRIVILAGLGTREKFDVEAARLAGAAAARRVQTEKIKVAAAVPPAGGALRFEDQVRGLVEGFLLGLHRFERFITDESRREHRPDALVLLLGRRFATGVKPVLRAQAVAAATAQVRDWVNTPAGRLGPADMAEEARRAARRTGVRVRVLDENELAAERMGAMLAVGRGSENPPRLVHLAYRPKGRPRARVALVGKGVMFDAGGYNLKGTEHIETMKCDMAGAAAVTGAVLALAQLGAPVEVHGVLGLVENLVSGRAYKPGDILETRSGKTVEVENTDAEGRLVLADALDWTRTTIRPQQVVDVATLTGACVVALGPHCTGLFSNDEALANRLLASARRAGEKVWRMPLIQEYREQFKSDIADLKNLGKRWGGAITGALFVETFADPKTPWAHLDIAGPAFLDEDHVICGKGGSGVGVATLVDYVLSL